MVDMFREYRSDRRIVAGRDLIGAYRRGAEAAPRKEPGYRALPLEVKALSHYLDNLGALVIREVVTVSRSPRLRSTHKAATREAAIIRIVGFIFAALAAWIGRVAPQTP
jgi:hypothetical protein